MFDLLPKCNFYVKKLLFVTQKSDQDPEPDPPGSHWSGFLDPDPDLDPTFYLNAVHNTATKTELYLGTVGLTVDSKQ